MTRFSRPLLLALPLVIVLAIIVFFFGVRDDPDARKIAARMSDTHIVHLIGGQREAVLALPRAFDAGRSYLLIISLHAYDSNAWEHDQYFRLSAAANDEHIALMLPQGLKDAGGARFWNATPWCCDFNESGVDDAAYLRLLIAEAERIVDIERIVAIGHSNGGFKAHRLACDGLPKLAAVVSLAGSSFADETRCADAAPVSVLQIHGDADEAVLYSGEPGAQGYPGALAVAHRWAQHAGCDPAAPTQAPAIDLDLAIDGAETAVQRWSDDCESDVLVELWTIHGGGHEPQIEETIAALIVDWLRSASVLP